MDLKLVEHGTASRPIQTGHPTKGEIECARFGPRLLGVKISTIAPLQSPNFACAFVVELLRTSAMHGTRAIRRNPARVASSLALVRL